MGSDKSQMLREPVDWTNLSEVVFKIYFVKVLSSSDRFC